MTNQEERNLRRLAALHRVQTSFIDMHGRRRFASSESLLGALRALGAITGGMGEVEESIRFRRNQIIGEWLPPVIVAWQGQSELVTIRVPTSGIPTHAIGPRLQYTLHLENGDIWSGNVLIDQARTLRYVTCAGEIAAVKSILPPKKLPLGYHKLTVLIGRRAFHAVVISAPVRSYHEEEAIANEWGVFAPLYALRSERNWGIGDFTDAEALSAWTGQQGGSVLGTLPFLATYLDFPCDPSPYTPISRFFWNELFIDVTRLPELGTCFAAQELIGSALYQSEIRAQRENRLVDYKQSMRFKRQVLLLLSSHLRESRGMRYDSLRPYSEKQHDLSAYARFRAMTAHRKEVWTEWPGGLRDGQLEDVPSDRREEFYHHYVQFAASEQIAGLARRCESENVALYLDYPLGTHPQGFDTWQYRDQFAMSATVGAPPDPVFTTGQDWGFHPLSPDAQRRDGYSYLAASVRHQMQHAGMMRLDHVMGMHRLYWIPAGMRKSEGVYVHYRSEELYAVLTLESQRARTVLIGENLGIVPGYVRQSMERHGLSGMNVAYWEMAYDPDRALERMVEQPQNVACLNTHDMFPFAAFWHGLDADRREELGMITAEQADLERWQRGELRARLTAYLREHGYTMTSEGDTEGALRGILSLLARSRARWVLINLEDLWLETSPQNIPDTISEHPNWRQKTRLSLEELIRDEGIRELLEMVQSLRMASKG